GLGGLDPLQQGVDYRLLVAGGQVGAVLVGNRRPFADLVEQRGLDAAEAKVEAGRAGSRKANRARIALRGQGIDRRATRKRQAEDARALVEGLPRRIVDRSTDHRDAAVLVPADQGAV